MSLTTRSVRSGDGAPPASFTSPDDDDIKVLACRVMELEQRAATLRSIVEGRRCPRSPGQLAAYCSQCASDEPGHGVATAERGWSHVKQELAELRKKLRRSK